jgi:hypothetical protein
MSAFTRDSGRRRSRAFVPDRAEVRLSLFEESLHAFFRFVGPVVQGQRFQPGVGDATDMV